MSRPGHPERPLVQRAAFSESPATLLFFAMAGAVLWIGALAVYLFFGGLGGELLSAWDIGLRCAVFLAGLAVIAVLAIKAMSRGGWLVLLPALATLGFVLFVGYWSVRVTADLVANPLSRIAPLHQAACKGDLAGVRRELARRVPATTRDTSGGVDRGGALQAYFRCFEEGNVLNVELVDLLLAAGADLDDRKAYRPYDPLELVLLRERKTMRERSVRYLVGKGMTPGGAHLGIAASVGDVESVRLLLALGAKPVKHNLADYILTYNQALCAPRQGETRPAFDFVPFAEAADLLIDNGLVVDDKALAKGLDACGGRENRMVTYLSQRQPPAAAQR